MICPVCLCAQDNFSLGADISWCTEMESRGNKLYNYLGEEREATALMKECGLNAIRLRVWVDPKDHGNWCNKEDLLVKCLRAKELGMDIMVDFHYSDWWADPAKQNIPAAWAKHKYKQMLVDVADHTHEVLQLLKDNDVTPKWVQVGNETANGMLWPIGKLDENPKQYAGLFKAGYEAVKDIFPDAKVIVHLDRGHKESLYNENLDALRDNGAKWDLIGMSLYPYWVRKGGNETSAARIFSDCIRNIRMVSAKYGTDVIITETGFEVNEQEPCVMESGRTQLAELIRLCRTATEGHCLGVFYWEPTCKPKPYVLGAFTSDGRPTAIMRGFTTSVLNEELNILPSCRSNIKYDRPRVRLTTSEGDIVMELYNETPLHRDNIIRLVKDGEIDNMLIHRVLNSYLIQTGDPDSKTAPATSVDSPAPMLGMHEVKTKDGESTIKAEIMPQVHFHKKGAVAAARDDESTNPELKSSASQFYITLGKYQYSSDATRLSYYNEETQAGLPALDGKYTVFGEVIQGIDIAEKISRLAADKNDRPLKDIRIIKATIIEDLPQNN